MKEKFFDFLLSAFIAAVVTLLVILQDAGLSNSGILAMACVGFIAGIIAGVMKMVIMAKFDKGTLIASAIGSAVIYLSVVFGILFRIASC